MWGSPLFTSKIGIRRQTFGSGMTLERRLAERSSSIASEKPVPTSHQNLLLDSCKQKGTSTDNFNGKTKDKEFLILTYLTNALKFFIVIVITGKEECAIDT